MTPKRGSGGWLPPASLRLEMVVVLHLATLNRTFHVLAHVSILAKSWLRDATARSLSSLDLTKDIMMASSAFKRDWFFRSCEMSSIKMINRRGLIWSPEVPQRWFFSIQTLFHSGRPPVIYLGDSRSAKHEEYLKTLIQKVSQADQGATHGQKLCWCQGRQPVLLLCCWVSLQYIERHMSKHLM